jgi:hypothetical protein
MTTLSSDTIRPGVGASIHELGGTQFNPPPQPPAKNNMDASASAMGKGVGSGGPFTMAGEVRCIPDTSTRARVTGVWGKRVPCEIGLGLELKPVAAQPPAQLAVDRQVRTGPPTQRPRGHLATITSHTIPELNESQAHLPEPTEKPPGPPGQPYPMTSKASSYLIHIFWWCEI